MAVFCIVITIKIVRSLTKATDNRQETNTLTINRLLLMKSIKFVRSLTKATDNRQETNTLTINRLLLMKSVFNCPSSNF